MEAGRKRLETGFPGLDVIRFGAALMITFYHLALIGPWRLGEEGRSFREAFAAVQPVTSSLWVGVHIFFLLSGVVIAFSAEGRGAGEFARRRAMRLYPAALICATVTVLVWPTADWLSRYLRSITLFPVGPWVSDVYWTLAVELTFYLMVVIALLLGGSRWIGRLARLLVLASTAWWALRIGNMAAGDLLRPIVDGAQAVDRVLLLSHGCFFGLGMLLYERRARGSSRLLTALTALGTATCLAAVASSARSFGPPGSGGNAMAMLLPVAVWALAFGAMLVALARGGRPAPGPNPVQIVRQIGLATYPLYLVHAEVGIALMLLLAPLGPVPALALATIGVLLLVATILPAEHLLRRLVRALTGTEAAGGGGADGPIP